MVHSSSSSGIFFQEDGQSQAPRNPHLSSYGNVYSNMVPFSGDSAASSVVTDTNSGLSGGPRLQKSPSINTESYTRLPASPLSFSSNNISILGSSVVDGPPPVQPSSNHDPTSGPYMRLGPGSIVSGPFNSDHDDMTRLQKRPRLDVKPEGMMQQQILRQILQRQDAQNPNLQALYHQQHVLQSLPPVQRAQLLQKLQQQSLPPVSAANPPYNGGVCSRRLMQYLYHQRQRPADISYWRKFVAEYYSPRAKQRWCLSLYSNSGHHSLGVFPPATMDSWQCGICGSKSGRGFEATFEILPRLNEIKFSSGVIDELWFLDVPRESRFPSGIMILEYAKAVQESVYEQLRVVHEGRLKIIFTPDLKILSWDFCARRHEELLLRRLVAPQVNQLLQVAQKCQSTIAESGSNGLSQQDLLTNSNMVVMAGRQLARSLELQSLNDLGFSKRYVRTLQISEVVNSLKDLMDFSGETKSGPIESLRKFPEQTRIQKMQGTEQILSIQGHPTDRTVFSNLVGLQPRPNGPMNHGGQGAPVGSVQAALALSSYQNMVMGSNSNHNGSPFKGLVLQNNNNTPAVSGGYNSNYQRFPSGVFQVQQNHHQQPPGQAGGPAVECHMIQQAAEGMNAGGGPMPTLSGQSSGLTRSNSFRAASHSDSCAGGEKAGDLGHVSDIFQDIASEITENGFLADDGVGYVWKA